MTEEEWLTSTNPWQMAAFVRGTATHRKIRLVTCACLQHAASVLGAPELLDVIAVAGKYADQLIHSSEWDAARAHAFELEENARQLRKCSLEQLTSEVTRADNCNILEHTIGGASSAVGQRAYFSTLDRKERGMRYAQAYNLERGIQCAFLRDIIGNPFQIIQSDPSWLTSTVSWLAQAVYEDSAFDRLPILADALEEAGCTNAEILAHLRSPGPHVRGCWALDLVLAKE